MTKLVRIGLVSLAIASLGIGQGALAQADGPVVPERWDPDYEPPRMADGTPSFAGVWSKASLTTLEKLPEYDSVHVTPQKAWEVQQADAQFMKETNAATDPDAPAYEEADDPGIYNTFWFDRGDRLAAVDGEYRSAWIVEPDDGKVPYSEDGLAKMRAASLLVARNFDDPEARPPGERCTVGFGSTGTPPMVNVLYNNHVQFFQAGDVISILAEMNHNARMVRMGGAFRDDVPAQWTGDSVGEWEGDTLIVRTTHFHPGNSVRGGIRHRLFTGPDTHVEERFTRVSDDVIFYEFTVTDPSLYTQPWRGEMPLWRTDGPIYEYACHEGNYALPGILRGARRKEADAAKAAELSGITASSAGE